MFPLTFPEIGADIFKLDEALHFGTLPKIYAYDNPNNKQELLESYAHLFLREVIAAEQLVRKIDPFRKFLEVSAQANAKIINHFNIARSCGVDVKTVQNYFQILEDTHLGFILEPLIPSIRERVMRHPKFYFFDRGVCMLAERRKHLSVRPYERSEERKDHANGVSTCKVKNIMESMCGFDVSSQEVSRATAALDEQLRQWITLVYSRIFVPSR
jgi:predicted AAA+ superfamily ATPase